MKKNTFHHIYGAVVSIALVVAGICLILACYGIYHSGERPFTPEAVKAAFQAVSAAVYVCLALVIVGFIIDGFWNVAQKKAAPEKQYHAILTKLHAKANVQTAPVIALQKKRKFHKAATCVLLVLGSLMFLGLGIPAANFTMENISGSMVTAVCWLLFCMAAPFGYGVFTAYHCRKSMILEIELMKQAMAEGAPNTVAASAKKPFPMSALRWALLGIVVIISIYGFLTGGTQDVLTKAVNICTECVGLG